MSLNTKSREKEPICIDTNILVGYGRKVAREIKTGKNHKRRKEIKEGGVLQNLFNKYTLLTSFFTRYEFIKILMEEEGISLSESRFIYQDILNKFRISEITFQRAKMNITYEFLDALLKTNISLGDGIHAATANKLKLKLVTGNTEHIKNMREFYREIITPRQALQK